jgi:hypothetical protein
VKRNIARLVPSMKNASEEAREVLTPMALSFYAGCVRVKNEIGIRWIRRSLREPCEDGHPRVRLGEGASAVPGAAELRQSHAVDEACDVASAVGPLDLGIGQDVDRLPGLPLYRSGHRGRPATRGQVDGERSCRGCRRGSVVRGDGGKEPQPEVAELAVRLSTRVATRQAERPRVQITPLFERRGRPDRRPLPERLAGLAERQQPSTEPFDESIDDVEHAQLLEPGGEVEGAERANRFGDNGGVGHASLH